MTIWGIRQQVLALSLVPAVLIAGILVVVTTFGRFDDLEQALLERGRLMALQLAQQAELGVFSGDESGLQSLTQSAALGRDVRAVRIRDASGRVLAQSGESSRLAVSLSASAMEPRPSADGEGLVITLAVGSAPLPEDALFREELTPRSRRAEPEVGYVDLEISRERLTARKRYLLLWSTLVTVGGLLLAVLLALALGRSLTRPLLGTTEAVARIRAGDLRARVTPSGARSLRNLANGVNAMAQALEAARDHLQARIDAATRELRERRDEAERATVAKSRFLAMASHDLRQPMHALSMFVAQLAEAPPGVERETLVRNIEQSVEAIESFLDALLDMSRLDAGVLVPRRSAVRLAPLLQRVELDLAVVARERGVRFLVRPTDLAIETDPVLFERILRNLASNALRHTHTGTVLVACRRRAGSVRVEVRDSGVGIAPEFQSEIFREFVQLANPEQDRRKGLGLGLAIVDRLTRLLGHRIDLRSAPGRGSVFAVTAARAAPESEEVTSPGEGARPLRLSVALLDDDELVRGATGSLLRRWGCTVHSAESAEELLRDWPPDLPMDFILSDFRLRQGRTGFQEIQRLRGWAGREVPAAVISGDAIPSQESPQDVVLLAKPLRAAALRSLLARRQARSGS